MSKFWIVTRFRDPKTADEENDLFSVTAEPDDTLLKVAKCAELPRWVDLEELAFWEMTTPVRRQAYDTIEYSSPATDETLHALAKRLFIADVAPAEADTIKILVTNFSYHPITVTLTPTLFVGHVHVQKHVKPQSLISRIVEDIREQYKLSTENILIYTTRYPLSLDDVEETLNPSDPNLIRHNLLKRMDQVFPNAQKKTALSSLAIQCDIVLKGFAKETEPPSKVGVPAAFYARQKKTGNGILCHRPAAACSIFPAVLIVEAFGKFVDDLSPVTSLVPSLGDYEFAHEWRDIALELYDKEDEMMGVMRELWKKHGTKLGTSKPLQSSTATTDGDLISNGSMYLIIEGKTALGSGGGADAVLQALWYKVYSLLQKQKAGRLRDTFSEPCFVVIIVGPYVGVFGAAFTDRLIADSLCPVENFLFHPTDDTSWKRIALLICALKTGIKKLQSECPDYTPTQTPVPSAEASLNPDRVAILPYQCSFVDAKDQTIRTVSSLHHLDKEKLVYSGILDDTSTRVFVKYVQRYSEEAHHACCDLGFAPKLLGSGTLHAGWRMIVMEWLDPEKWNSLFYAPERLTPSRIEYALEKISEFGNEGWVHGDIRDANVMVFIGSEDEAGDNDVGVGVRLVDFDWSGHHEEVFYPHNMETKAIRRAKGAVRLGVIKREHDLEMMRHTCGSPVD